MGPAATAVVELGGSSPRMSRVGGEVHQSLQPVIEPASWRGHVRLPPLRGVVVGTRPEATNGMRRTRSGSVEGNREAPSAHRHGWPAAWDRPPVTGSADGGGSQHVSGPTQLLSVLVGEWLWADAAVEERCETIEVAHGLLPCRLAITATAFQSLE